MLYLRSPLIIVTLLITELIINHNLVNACDHGKMSNSENENHQLPNHQVKDYEIKTFYGKLIYEPLPPVMSVKSYLGEEFFLITDSQKLVLRTSKTVSREDLISWQNQQVQISTKYVPGTRPDNQNVSCPVDPHGQCLPQGQGYQVLSIRHFVIINVETFYRTSLQGF